MEPWFFMLIHNRSERGTTMNVSTPMTVLPPSMWRAWFVVVVLATHGCTSSSSGDVAGDDVFSPAIFANPPTSFGPQARWWWPGGSVDDATLRDELAQLAELGYSAVEIQPFMAALTNADLREDDRIRTVGEASFLVSLGVAACAARDVGLAWDLTLGSGWSTGGPDVGDDGSRQLIAAEQTLEGPLSHVGPLPEAAPPSWIDATNRILPAIDGFDEETALVSVLAAPVIEESEDAPAVLGEVIDLGDHVDDGTLTWDVPPGVHRVFAVYENRTQHVPFGNAYAAPLEQARVIDHLDRRGVEGFLERQFAAWVDAAADCPPRAVFIDSFELAAELPWTTAFGDAFTARLGYDIAPFQPFLFLDGGESEYVNIFGEPGPRYAATDGRGVRAREDYEAFRGARFSEETIQIVGTWAAERGIELRLQAHGGYADALEAYSIADVPESEGLYAGGSYDFLRLAASAAEVGGKRFSSSETLVTVGARELSAEEVRLLFGRAFSAGINRLMLHGHPYPYEHTDGVRWFPFGPRDDSAATAGPADLSFDIHPGASIWSDLPSLNAMATRLGYAMSRGRAEAEVAWLYPTWKVTNFPNFAGVVPEAFESETSGALRRAGLSYTRVSRSALRDATAADATLRVGEAEFAALLVSELDVADPAVLASIQNAAAAGVPVVWLGALPARADGLVNAETRDAEVTALAETLAGAVAQVADATEIPTALLAAGIAPALHPLGEDGTRLSFAHRAVRDGDLYYVFNESFETRTERFEIAGEFSNITLLDPDAGRRLVADLEGDALTITLGPARGMVLSIERVRVTR